jgi:hypothetical protein
MADPIERITANLEQALADVKRLERAGDVIDAIRDGGVLTVRQAAIICDRDDQTIYRWIEDAAQKGRPLGLKQATWMVGTERLLDYVEKHQGGLPARVKAENRLGDFWAKWSQPQGLRAAAKDRATG